MMWISTIKSSRYRTIFLFFCLSLISTAYSETKPVHTKKAVCYDSTAIAVRTIPSEEFIKLLNDPDYGYTEVSKAHKTILDRFFEWLFMKFGKSMFSKKGRAGLTIIEYLFIALAVGLIVFLLLNKNLRSLFYGKSATASLEFIESIEDINEINFDQRIADEVSKRDFRKAVRLHFLRVIKELSEQKLINWQMDKTNADYSRELKNNKYSRQFEELIRLYEYIWYGDFKLEEANFLMVIQKFDQFKINQEADVER
jgi:hypothetical protein